MTLTAIITFALAVLLLIRIVCLGGSAGIDRCTGQELRCLALATAYAAQLAGAIGLGISMVWPESASALSFAPPLLVGGVLLRHYADRRLM